MSYSVRRGGGVVSAAILRGGREESRAAFAWLRISARRRQEEGGVREDSVGAAQQRGGDRTRAAQPLLAPPPHTPAHAPRPERPARVMVGIIRTTSTPLTLIYLLWAQADKAPVWRIVADCVSSVLPGQRGRGGAAPGPCLDAPPLAGQCAL